MCECCGPGCCMLELDVVECIANECRMSVCCVPGCCVDECGDRVFECGDTVFGWEDMVFCYTCVML